jgi:hypothetical protein
MKLFGVFCIGIRGATLLKEESSQFLQRSARKNSWHAMEETKQGNMERECIEEDCDQVRLIQLSDTNF